MSEKKRPTSTLEAQLAALYERLGLPPLPSPTPEAMPPPPHWQDDEPRDEESETP